VFQAILRHLEELKKMSQMHVEQIHFPWIIFVVTIISSVLIFKIGQWGYEYVVWLWNNRLPVKKHHSSKSKKKAKKHVSSSDEEGSDESSE